MKSFTLHITHDNVTIGHPIDDASLATAIKTLLNIHEDTPCFYAKAHTILGDFDIAYGIFSTLPNLYKEYVESFGHLINDRGTCGSFLIKAIQQGDYDTFVRALEGGSCYIGARDEAGTNAIGWALEKYVSDDAYIRKLVEYDPQCLVQQAHEHYGYLPVTHGVFRNLPIRVIELLKPTYTDPKKTHWVTECIAQAFTHDKSYALEVLGLLSRWKMSFKDPEYARESYIQKALLNPNVCYLEVIKALVSGGSDLNFVSSASEKYLNYNLNALMLALKTKVSSDIIRYLCRETSNIELKNKVNQTALHYAAYNYPRAVSWIIKENKNYTAGMLDVRRSIVDNHNKHPTALHLAALKGAYKAVRALLDAGADATIQGPDKKRAIFYAIESKNVKTVKAFADYVDQTYGSNQWTTLIQSVHTGSVETTRALLRMGANPNARDKLKWTAAAHAARYAIDHLPLLAKYKADLTIETNNKFNVGSLVCRHGSLDNIKHVYERYAMKASSRANGDYVLILFNDQLTPAEQVEAAECLNSNGIPGLNDVFMKIANYKSISGDAIYGLLELGASPRGLISHASVTMTAPPWGQLLLRILEGGDC